MSTADQQQRIPAGRGRRPIGERPMSAAERMRRTRERRRQEGGTGSFMVTLNEPYLRAISDLATARGTSRSAALKLIVEEALATFMLVTKLGERMLAAGATDEEMQAMMNHVYGADRVNEIKEALKGENDTGTS